MLLLVFLSIAFFALVSCDPTTIYQYGVTWSVVNKTDSTIYVKYDEGLISIRNLVDPEQILLIEMTQTDEIERVNTFVAYDSFQIRYSSSEFYDISKIINNKENWELKIYDGDKIPDKPSTSKYELWYDYTLVLTDSMLKR